MLKAHGNYILPKNVPANEFLNLEGRKISTSKNWAVWLHQYLEDFPDQQDVLRYVLCINAPENKDNDFTWADFQARNNNELVAILGNFINRVFVLCHKYWKGKVPNIHSIENVDKVIIDKIMQTPKDVGNHIDNYKFRFGLQSLMDLARSGNKYLADTQPWKLVKQEEGQKRTETILYISIQIASTLSIICEPFMLFTASKLRKMLNVDVGEWCESGSINQIPTHHQLNNPQLLFSSCPNPVFDQNICTFM